MEPQNEPDYLKVFSELIKKQMMVLGPQITLLKVRNIPGIEVTDTGNVTGVKGDPQQLFQQIIDQFVDLSGEIVKKTMESIMSFYAKSPESAKRIIDEKISTNLSGVSPINELKIESKPADFHGDFPPMPVSHHETKTDEKPSFSSQMGKEDLDNINQALSDLNGNLSHPLEKSQGNV